jgi:hypothetical protein
MSGAAEPRALIDLTRRHMLVAVSGSMLMGAVSSASAEEPPIDLANKCRECAGSGVVPCE